jgi:hypothetical protein
MGPLHGPWAAHRMREHSRGMTGERREVDLNVLIEEALNLAYYGARDAGAEFQDHIGARIWRGHRSDCAGASGDHPRLSQSVRQRLLRPEQASTRDRQRAIQTGAHGSDA